MTASMDLVDNTTGEAMTLHPSKVICLLRNYADHASEMGSKVPEHPSFFLKPPSALLPEGRPIVVPKGVELVHHEVELAAVVGKGGKDLSLEEAEGHVKGYLLMLDMTARDLQDAAKAKGLPWAQAKGYDTFAPFCRTFVRADSFRWRGRRLFLSVNGALRQEGSTSDMIFDIASTVSYLSTVMTLEEDDLILTGTPSGVGPVSPGDLIVAGMDGIGETAFHVEGHM